MADDKRYMGFWIGHLHVGERNRIQSGGLNPQEREMLAKGEDPWAKFRGPLPPGIQSHVPTKEAQEIATTAMDELREHVDGQLGGVVNTRVANDAFQQGVKASSPSPESSDTKESKGVREPTEAEVGEGDRSAAFSFVSSLCSRFDEPFPGSVYHVGCDARLRQRRLTKHGARFLFHNPWVAIHQCMSWELMRLFGQQPNFSGKKAYSGKAGQRLLLSLKLRPSGV